MISNLQKVLIETAAKEQPDVLVDLLAIAAIMHDLDTVIYITANHADKFPEEDREKIAELHDAAVKVQAELERESAVLQ